MTATSVTPEPETVPRYLGTCAWWVLCDRAATHRRPHPILGLVPICDRCRAKLAEMEGAA